MADRKNTYSPGATVHSLRNDKYFRQLAAARPDIVVLIIGGNYITAEVRVVDLYNCVIELVELKTPTINPAHGVFLIEPGKRHNPKFYRLY